MTVLQEKRGTPDTVTKILAAGLIILILAGAIYFLATGGAASLSARPGLFGTRATLSSDLNLIAQFILLLGLGIGAAFAHRGNITAHQYTQTGIVLFNLVLTIFIMAVSYRQNVIPKLPGILGTAYGLVSTIHAILGLLAIICGLYLIIRMNQLIPESLRISWWRNLMRFTLGLYWAVGLLGLGLYYVWYVL